MKGSIARAQEIVAATPGAWMPQQFDNPANIDVHVRTTAEEIAADFPERHRRADHRRRHRRPHHRLRAGAEEDVAEAQGVRGRAERLAGDQRRQAEPAPDPGHRRRLHPEEPARRPARRRDPGRGRGGARDGAALRRARRACWSASRRARRWRRSRRSCPSSPPARRVLGFNYDTGERYLSIEGFLPANERAPKILHRRRRARHRRHAAVRAAHRRLRAGLVRHRRGGAGAHRAATPPALVILDVGLPDASGFEIFKRLRETSDVPVVFLTARSDEIDRVVGLELGADDYVAKPFSPRELVARVRGDPAPQRQAARRGARPRRDGAAPRRCADRRRRRPDADPLLRPPARALALRVRPAARRSRRAPATSSRATRCSSGSGATTRESMDRTVDAHVKTLRAKMKAIAPNAGADPHASRQRLCAGRGPAAGRCLTATASPA